MSQWGLPSDLWKPLTCCAISALFLIGTAFIIYKAKKGLASGKVVGDSHWKECILLIQGVWQEKQHIDVSRLNEEGTGTVRFYDKPPKVAMITGLLSMIGLPIYVLTVVAYNLFRFIIIPFYIIVQIIRESKTNNQLYPSERRFSVKDIPKQMALSIGRMIQAPFYGLAMFFSSLYTLIHPMNAIKLGSAIEYDWNGQVPMRNSGIWMVACRVFKDWQWEGGGGPQKLGQNGFYFAGSWLPWLDAEFNQNKFVEIKGIRALDTTLMPIACNG